MRGLGQAEGRADVGGHDLARARQAPGGRLGDVDAHRAHARLEVGAGLLDDIQLVHGGGEVGDLLRRQGPGEPQLEGRRLGQRLAHVVVERAGHDDAHAPVTHLDAVEVALLGEGDEGVLALVGRLGAAHGVGRHHDVLADVGLVGARGHVGALAGDVGHRLGVGDAHGLVQHDRGVEALRDLERAAGEVVGLLRVGRVEARDAREGRVVARVLLVLRAVAGRVVGGQQHEAGVHARVGHAHERVGRDVDAHVLHRGERAHAAHGGADGHLEGDLLVGRPLAVDAVLLHQVLERLGRGGAGVSRAHGDAGLPRALRDGLVARKQLLGHVNSSPAREPLSARHITIFTEACFRRNNDFAYVTWRRRRGQTAAEKSLNHNLRVSVFLHVCTLLADCPPSPTRVG